MKNPKAPCYKCGDRVVGCHSTCDRYKEYAGIMAIDRESRRETSERNSHSRAKLSQTELKKRSKQ